MAAKESNHVDACERDSGLTVLLITTREQTLTTHPTPFELERASRSVGKRDFGERGRRVTFGKTGHAGDANSSEKANRGNAKQ